MRRLTVMLLVNDLRIGGAERQLVELARGLDRERFRVIVTTLYSGQPFEADLRDCPTVDVIPLERRGKFDFGALFRLVGILRREEVDIIQPFLTPATAFGMAAAMIAGTPVKIVTERCGVRLNTSPGNNLYRFVEDRLARFADAVIPNSEAGARYVLSRGISREKVRVIYNGVAPERVDTDLAERQELRARLGVSDENWLIGIVASLTPAKDHGTFLQAASIVRAEVPGTRFMLVGDGPLRAELQKRASLLGLDGSVIFAGHQMNVASYIGAMDVAALSSCDHEGCSNFLLEAMGLGRPIVATDIGGNRELFESGDAGLLVPPRNPLILAHAILEVMRREEATDRMRKRGREIFQERFTLPRMVSAYEDLYGELWENHEVRSGESRAAAETVREG
jgi:glycosyltransferase involved in cell wall biosynthesis